MDLRFSKTRNEQNSCNDSACKRITKTSMNECRYKTMSIEGKNKQTNKQIKTNKPTNKKTKQNQKTKNQRNSLKKTLSTPYTSYNVLNLTQHTINTVTHTHHHTPNTPQHNPSPPPHTHIRIGTPVSDKCSVLPSQQQSATNSINRIMSKSFCQFVYYSVSKSIINWVIMLIGSILGYFFSLLIMMNIELFCWIRPTFVSQQLIKFNHYHSWQYWKLTLLLKSEKPQSITLWFLQCLSYWRTKTYGAEYS